MCSIPGLPTPGASVSVLITGVNLNPVDALVELWGNFNQERKHIYQRMRREIQFPRERFCESDGNPGDLCLIQIFETWYRARVVSRNGSICSVFLIDEGRTLTATTSALAWGSNDFFHLPPEVEFCVLANVLPLSSENRWSPMALEFLKSLCGKTFHGCVQDVFVPQRTFLLDIPSIAKQMYEMGFARKLSIEKFKHFVARTLQSMSGDVVFTDFHGGNKQGNEQVESHVQNEKWQSYLYPELQAETVETVIVTEVTNPLRVFCQLKVFSQELKKLTEQITRYYEGRVRMGSVRTDILGHPCAAKGSDGKWYRSVLQQVLASSSVVEVLHVDFGKKDFVQIENIKPLAAEFFRMPIITYVCSLYGIIDKGVGWTAAQVGYLKSLLLHRTVIAKFEYQSLSEGVHYVTLFGDENVNINNLFGRKEKCLLETEKSLEEFDARKPASSCIPQDSVESEKLNSPVFESTSQNVKETESLAVNSSHVGVVQYVNNPSEFWIQTERYGSEFDQLMQGLNDLYDHSRSTEGLVKYPTVGLLCAVRSEDSDFYRAVVHEVVGKHVKVYFVDYGNVEVVDQINLRVLPDKYQELPALALKCALSGIKPKDGKWSPSAVVFFSKAVENKILDIRVVAKSQETHIVQLIDPSAHGERNISKMLCGAGLAECDDFKKPLTRLAKNPLVQAPSINSSEVDKMKNGDPIFPTSLTTATDARSVFKEHLFAIGSSLEVNVSHIESPNDFWCQVAQTAGSLKLLMEDVQKYYANSKPQQPVEVACVARHPGNRMWYRALIISKNASPYVDVLFIDYGWTEKIPLEDLRPINPVFLKLKGQAFRCSLYNLVHPVDCSTLEWSDMAKLEFQRFVDSAVSSHLSLKCTIYAVMCDSQSVVFNVVDLETPFQSICGVLVQKRLASRGLPKKVPRPPFRLDTYYYSTHDVKTGGEERVRVTCVKNVNHFYCQLERNSGVIDKLIEKVNYLCRQLQGVNCPKTFGTVCFAKYTDGQWYRCQIKSIQPTIQVHFVDYGDTLEMDKSDLLPIPIEAGEIMSVPVQAIECGLSDVPEDVSCEVNDWFEKNVTDRCFTVLVVAKEPCGKLIVELYDDKTQVNLMIKGKFSIETARKGGISFEKYEKPNNAQDLAVSHKVGLTSQKYKSHPEDMDTKCKPAKCIANVSFDAVIAQNQEDSKKFSSVGIQWEPLVMEGHTKHSPEELNPYSKTPARNHIGECERSTAVVSKTEVKSFPKLEQLPLKSIKENLVSEVYISHINNLSSFFVQLTEDEDEIYSIVSKINSNQSATVQVSVDVLQSGDLVNAVFPDDGSWYRGVVRNVFRNGTVCVEFLDFGNTATVPPSEISRLDEDSLALPRQSIHCSLNVLPYISKEEVWNQEDLANFKKAIGENENKKLMCTFIKQVGCVWEVSLEDQGVNLANVLFKNCPVVKTDVMPEGPQNPDSAISISDESKKPETVLSSYKLPGIFEGQTVDVYASSITDPHYFWCQHANTDELQRISKAAEKIGKVAQQNASWVESLSIGTPCLSLFEEDEQWYRAVVTAKTGDVLSILFVDYGNECDVDVSKLKQVSPELLETPPQAFLCLLSGFDASQGAWDDNALDHFTTFITDELLKVTIVKVEDFVDRRTPQYQVSLDCKGQIVNDAMRPHWKLLSTLDYSLSTCSAQSSPVEDTTAPVGSSVMLPSLQLDSKKTADVTLEECCIQSSISGTDFVLHDQQQQFIPENKPTNKLLSVEEQTNNEEDLDVDKGHLENATSVLNVGNDEKDERRGLMEEMETEDPQKTREGNMNAMSEELFGREESHLSEISANEDGGMCVSDHARRESQSSLSLEMTTEEDTMGFNVPTSDLSPYSMEKSRKCHPEKSENEHHMEQAYLVDEMDSVVCQLNDKFSLVEGDEHLRKGIFEQNSRTFEEDTALVHILSCEDTEGCVMTRLDSSTQSPFVKLEVSEDRPVIGSECIPLWDGNNVQAISTEQCEGARTVCSDHELSTEATTEEEVKSESLKADSCAETDGAGLDEEVGIYQGATALDLTSVAGELKPAAYDSGGVSFVEQMSNVMHLALKVGEQSDDDVTLVEETRIPWQLAQKLSGEK